ncbi:glycosyltransferase family 4 protein [Rhodopirellula sallentina]|uniref:Hexosyltransferase n=1 Tax=Rhodopirellula sallentina SM41 TaxID=1263870 RepID=M5U500_9BACT|nr:glycosyltransferase family 4 protein [Rhodopirellula sallentina]EMI56339.1 hexosyltransferase [Rhodopirellula sallentina SM41]
MKTSASTIECRPPVDSLDARVVFLTHYIPLYQVRVLQEISRSLQQFRVLLSTPIEPNRDFRLDWSGLDVEVQKAVTIRRRWRHRNAGFDDPLYVHVPYDTLGKLKSLRPDVVISHELGARSLAAARYCRRSGAKLVLATFMSEHTEQGRGWLRQRIRKHLIARADAITYNGPSCRNYLLSLGACEEQLFHLPYAADDRNFSDVAVVRDEPSVRRRLLCIGQLSERKGVLPMIEQLSEFCERTQQSLEVTLVGDGPLRPGVEEIAARHAEAGQDSPEARLQIHVLGNQPASELPSLMSEHGAVIAPTLADEWLLVVNEAMHAGLPVIGSVYAQAVVTMVRDDENGWQYDPLRRSESSVEGDVAASLQSVLSRYLELDDYEVEAMRANAVTTASAYTPSRSARGALRAIRSVLGMSDRVEPGDCVESGDRVELGDA